MQLCKTKSTVSIYERRLLCKDIDCHFVSECCTVLSSALRLSPPAGLLQELQQKRAHKAAADTQHAAEAEPENLRQTAVVGRKKLPKISPTNKSPASPSNNSPMSPTDVKTKNTGPHCFTLQWNISYIVLFY